MLVLSINYGVYVCEGIRHYEGRIDRDGRFFVYWETEGPLTFEQRQEFRKAFPNYGPGANGNAFCVPFNQFEIYRKQAGT